MNVAFGDGVRVRKKSEITEGRIMNLLRSYELFCMSSMTNLPYTRQVMSGRNGKANHLLPSESLVNFHYNNEK